MNSSYSIAPWRMNLLRLMYLVVVVGNAIVFVPGFLRTLGHWELMDGIVECMMISFWLLAIFGLRYPLQLLPIILWETIWKLVWIGSVGFPAVRSGTIDSATQANLTACSVIFVFLLFIPWDYVYQHYLRKAGEIWKRPVGMSVN